MNIKTVFDFNKALDIGPYAWPGGYPFYFIAQDGEAISFAAAKENAGLIRDAIISCNRFVDSGGKVDCLHDDWNIVAMEINWEDESLFCAHTGLKIESAYGNDEQDLMDGS
jgi:hypothetical protein